MKSIIKSRKLFHLLIICILLLGSVLVAAEIFAAQDQMDKNIYYRVLDQIVKSSAFDKGTMIITGVTCTIGLIIAIAFSFIQIPWHYIKGAFAAISDKGAQGLKEFPEMVRAFVLIALIITYVPVIKVITESMEFVNKFTSPGSEQYQQLESWSDEIYKKHIDEKEGETDPSVYKEIIDNPGKYTDAQVQQAKKLFSKSESLEGKIKSDENKIQDKGDGSTGLLAGIMGLKNAVRNIASALIVGLITILGQIVRVVVMIFAVYTMKIVIIIGPLAIGFSVLKVFEDNLERWFKFFLQLGFVFTTLNIIDHINFIFLKQCFTLGAFTNPDPTEASLNIVISMVNLILYTLPFFLTSLFVGSRDGAKIMTKTIQTATAVAMLIATGGAGTAASAAASNVGKAAEAGSKAIEEN